MEINKHQLYREVILEHCKNPHSEGLVEDLPVYESKNASCGDNVSLQVEFDDDGKIKSIYQKSIGCSVSVSSTSILTQILKGKTRQEAVYMAENFLKMIEGEPYDENINFEDGVVYENIRDYPARRGCVSISWQLVLKILKEK